MKKSLVLFGLVLVLFSCKKKENNVCYTCVITKSINSATTSKQTKDTVIHCGENEQDINAFIRANSKWYMQGDSSCISETHCH